MKRSRRHFLVDTGLVSAAMFSPLPLRAIAPSTSSIHVDASTVLHRICDFPIGVNLEDLNYQTYGGLYSQLLYAESFQENVDSSLLGLGGAQRLQVYIDESQAGELEVWGWDGRRWAHDFARNILKLPPKGDAITVALSELPAEKRDILLCNAREYQQVSRHWNTLQAGSAQARFGFERAHPFIGRQSQRIKFVGGEGEVGIENAGPNRWGIAFAEGKVYEGVLRLRAEDAADVHLALISSGGEILAEKSLYISPSAEYTRIEFTLTPRRSDAVGRFRISLHQPASITVGYVFLQPGAWGRYKGLPIRSDLAFGMLGQGIQLMRYNGSMVNRCPQPELYKWKQMLGPAETRKPYHGMFNPFASNGFGIFEFLKLCSAAGLIAIPGIRSDETPADMTDFIEYVNGLPGTPWGSKRAIDGHTQPYNLRHLQIGNEEHMDDLYCDRFEGIARAIWKSDPHMVLLIASNLRSPSGQDPWAISGNGTVSPELQCAARLIKFARDAGGTIWWDNHVLADEDHAGDGNANIVAIHTLQKSIAKLVPGASFAFASLEENGQSHTMVRALAHARNANAFSRIGDMMRAIATANALQAAQPALVWSQGNTFFSPSAVWFQASYYIDQVRSRQPTPNIIHIETTGAGDTLDVLARLSDDRQTLVIEVVNVSANAVSAEVRIDGFLHRPYRVKVIEIAAAPDAENTQQNPRHVAPRDKDWTYLGDIQSYSFAPSSFTQLIWHRNG